MSIPISSAPGFYVVGGTIRPDAPSYVRRDSDDELYTGLIENDFCHVLTARQMGKSSLMLRTAARLRQAGIDVAALDLTGIGTNVSPEQWYSGLIVQLGARLDLEDELLEFWSHNLSIGPMQRWISAIRKVVLPSRTGRLAIFIDEIDAVASLNFSTDEFFSGIRECYNLRNDDAAMNRLTFCLLGVVNPSELIRDTRTTPFNVGRRIELNDFTEQEALALAAGLGRSAAENRALLKRILYWTNGHPYLTQRLCKVVSENGVHQPIDDLDGSIERTFFSKRAQEDDHNLIFVRERLLHSSAEVSELLTLYSRVRRNKIVPADDSQPLVSILRLSGITRAENGRLRVRNRIYDRVFNDKWVTANLPGAEIRRQRAAFRRGVLRTAGVAAVILTVVVALGIVALQQRNRAREQTAVINQMLYDARMKLANQEYENFNIARVKLWVDATTPQPGETDLRGFEWFLFWRYAHTEVMRLTEPGQIAAAKFHQGNDTIAIASVEHTVVQDSRRYAIKLYDRGSQKEISSFKVPASSFFNVVTFSPDNKYVVTDAPDDSVILWDASSRQRIHRLDGVKKAVLYLTFAPDQKALACAFSGGTYRVWDSTSGNKKFDVHSKSTKLGVAFSPDNKRLAAVTDHNVIEILDAETGKSLRSFSFPKSPLGLIFFSPDGRKLFATTTDGYLYGLNIHDGKPFSFSQTHANEVSSFSFSPDGKTLATGSEDRTLKVWDVAVGSFKKTIVGHGVHVTAVDWSTDGRYLLSGDSGGLIKMWDMQEIELPVWPAERPASVNATGFTLQNELVAIGLGADKHLKLWNLTTGKMLDLGPAAGDVDGAAFSKDATMVAVAIASEIRVYSVTTAQLISKSTDRGKDIYSLHFSPDHSKLLSGNRNGDVIVSEVATGQTQAKLDTKNMYYRAVFSSNGRKIATANKDGTIKVWDVQSKSIERTLSGHEGVVRLLSFSPDDRTLASAADDHTVRLWDPATGQELKKPIQSDSVQRMIFTPDGKRLVTVSFDGAVILWNSESLQEVVTLRRGGRPSQPTSISFSHDGLILAVSELNGAVKVWQAGKPSL